jgi:asparagine synthase (glutamine-hydrolysing)
MLPQLNGMGRLDARERTLFAARSRFGVKPFYYTRERGRLAFASELKPLVLGGARTPRAEAIHALVARDWVDHTEETFFEGVYQLEAGHCLTARAGAPGQAGTVTIRRWWNLDPSRREALAPDAADARFAELFDDAVRLRLRADVPVGTCLSGGLDSTAIVVTAAPLLPHALETFSVAYDEGEAFDERPFVEQAVRASGAASHVVVPAAICGTRSMRSWAPGGARGGPGCTSQWHVMTRGPGPA